MGNDAVPSSPSLAEILARLANDWSIVRNRHERHRMRYRPTDDAAATAADAAWAKCDEELHRHPFLGAIEWATVQTGIPADDLRAAAARHFDGDAELVAMLRAVDQAGQTARLWQMLVAESPDVLRRAGLVTADRTDRNASTDRTDRNAGGEGKEGEVNDAARRKRRGRKKRGRPADTDAREDKRVYDAWKSRQYKSLAALADALGTAERDVRAAVERHRKRLARRRK